MLSSLDEARFQRSRGGKISNGKKRVEFELSLERWLGACQVDMM